MASSASALRCALLPLSVLSCLIPIVRPKLANNFTQSYDSEFCKGVVQREGPVIAQAIRAMELNSTIANQFCITFLGVCDYPAIQTWNVPFPSKQDCSAKRPVPAANSDKKPLQIIQFSDIHITPGYTEGASTQCGRPVCCTGATGNNSHPAGLMADHNCDTSPSLAQNMYDFMHETFPDQQQISLFTGDIIDHDLANTSETTNTADSKNHGIIYLASFPLYMLTQ